MLLVKGGFALFLWPNNRIINDNTYINIVDSIQKTPMGSLVDECRLIKGQLEKYDIDELRLIYADASGTEETLKFINLFLSILSFTVGLIIFCLTVFFSNPQMLVPFLIVVFLIVLLILWMSYVHRRRIGATVFIKEIVKICIQEKSRNC